MNVHIYSTKSIESFHVLQITHSDIRQPYFVQKVFSDPDLLREIMTKTIVIPYLSDKQYHLRFLEEYKNRSFKLIRFISEVCYGQMSINV